MITRRDHEEAEAAATWHGSEQPNAWRREQIVILVLIVLLSAGAWAYTAFGGTGGGMSMNMPAGAPDPAMEQAAMAGRLQEAATGLTRPAFAMFVPMWMVMCVAMMLPTVWPMAFAFATIARKRRARGSAFAPTWTFVVGFVLVWGAFGVVAWTAAAGLFAFLGNWLGDKHHLMLATGILFLAAGGYQISPLKNACLTTCRHPLLFVVHNWREGYRGAVAMGIHHGALCVGCCWALMVVLLPLGMMNLLWMGLFTLVMYLEKNIRRGVLIGRVAGVTLLAAGAVLLVLGAVLMSSMSSPSSLQL